MKYAHNSTHLTLLALFKFYNVCFDCRCFTPVYTNVLFHFSSPHTFIDIKIISPPRRGCLISFHFRSEDSILRSHHDNLELPFASQKILNSATTSARILNLCTHITLLGGKYSTNNNLTCKRYLSSCGGCIRQTASLSHYLYPE